MKNLNLCTLLLVLLFTTNLSGKIAIIGYDSGGSPDQVAFVSDEFVSAGTVIYFSEDEYDNANNRFLGDEGTVAYTVPVGGLPAGRVVLISENSTNTHSADDGGTVTQVGTGNWALSGTEEEIYAFTASNPASPLTTPTLVYCWFFIEGTQGPGSNEDPSSDMTVEIIINWNSKLAAAEYRRARNLPTSLTDILDEANWDFEITTYASSSTDFTGTFTLDLAMPVELTNFKVRKTPQKTVKVEWETAMEIQNQGFYMERSTDSRNWEPLGFIEGQGNSTENHYYHFEDFDIRLDQYYYRLRQIDFDGGSSYSPIRVITFPISNNEFQILVFPNPIINGRLTLQLTTMKEESGVVQVLDQMGKVVLEHNFAEAETTLETKRLPKGIYWLKVEVNKESCFEKIVVQ